ncbi:MAG: serine hydrolase domain-containing protein [Salinivirgaceae bacterium]
MKRTFIILLVLISSLTFQSFAQTDYEPLRAEFREKIDKTMRKNDIVGASVVLVVDDSIVWHENFGYTHEEQETPVNNQTQFKLGSVTKIFTGTGSMQMVEQNRLDLDAPVKNYVPDFSMKTRFEDAPAITSRMVLTHHAGMPSDIFRGFESDKPEPYTKELDYLNLEYATFPPNTIHSYSNPGFNFMGILLSRIYGKSYMDMMQETIFDPLNMDASGFWGISNDSNLSPSYNGKGKPVQEKYIREVPAGSMVSTTKDLATFIKNMLPENATNTILQKSTIEQMMETQNDDVALDFDDEYGIVWMKRNNNKCGVITHHGGATFYQRAMLALAPETNMGVAILTNSENGNRMCYLYDDILNRAAELNERVVENDQPNTEKPPRKKMKLSDKHLAQFEGYYGHAAGLTNLKEKRGKLHGKLDKYRMVLIPVDSSTFIPRIKLLGPIGFKIRSVRFHVEKINGMTLLVQEQVKSGSKDVIARKRPRPGFTQAWKERVGRYEIVNHKPEDFKLCKNFEIKSVNNSPVFSYQITVQYAPKIEPALIIENNQRAYITGLGRQGGYALQAKKDENGEEYLYFSGFKLKRIENLSD